jgi:DNA-binding protein H-NS
MNHDEMHTLNLDAMEFDELWLLYEQLTQILSVKISAEKLELEKRLAQLNRVEPAAGAKGSADRQTGTPRRKYPKVRPKYLNPSAPEETWSGRGKRPRWLVSALQSGHRLEEFQISEPAGAQRDGTDHGKT